jgi:hypothetical protein
MLIISAVAIVSLILIFNSTGAKALTLLCRYDNGNERTSVIDEIWKVTANEYVFEDVLGRMETRINRKTGNVRTTVFDTAAHKVTDVVHGTCRNVTGTPNKF